MAARQPALIFIFFTLFLDILGIGLVIPILPRLVENFTGGSLTEASMMYGWLAALYAVMQFLFAPILGGLSDRYGRRPVILASLFGSGIDYLVLAFAPTLGWFFVARIIAGIMGANITAASAYIADISPPEKRAKNFGIVGAAFGLAFSIGPALGGLLGELGLRVPFLVAAGLTLLNWCYGLVVLPESLPPHLRRPFSWRRANPVGSLLALRHLPIVLGLAGTWFLINVAHQVYPATWVLYTKYRFEWSAAETGASLALVGIMAAIVQGGLGRVLLPRLGERRAVVLGLAVVVLAFIGYGVATRDWMLYALIVFGALGGLATPAAQGLISRSVGPDEQGAVQGALTSIGSLASIVGYPLAAGAFSFFISDRSPVHLPGGAFFVGAALTLAGLLLAQRHFATVPAAAPAQATPASTGKGL